ncbi:Excinuclease ABC subunit A [hydrothermal vent metagenome]|uniref:Excinuclease ABC subunit A n=1 Tax=hydrothermal vent metagenome TaxID=652676 RepID=A0A3B0RM99_9ZZZZ
MRTTKKYKNDVNAAFELSVPADKDHLIIEGLRQNNLKNINVSIPHDKITAIVGPSGSGKSSLAFDTLFAEGRWRFMESLSTYTRLFLERMDRPDLDSIRNIRPAIAIEQKNPVRTSRSTVGTATEINDYLRILFARAGKLLCPDCALPVTPTDPAAAWKELLKSYDGAKALIGFTEKAEATGRRKHPTKEELETVIERLLAKGFIRIIAGDPTTAADGEVLDISEDKASALKAIKASGQFMVVVDRVVIKADKRGRVVDSLETSFREGEGSASVRVLGSNGGGDRHLNFTRRLTCTGCGFELEKPTPILFSFNHPLGACNECKGFGNILLYDEDKLVPDKGLTLREGAIEPWTKPASSWWYEQLEENAEKYDLDLDKPYCKLSKRERAIIFKGTEDFDGFDGFFDYLDKKKYKLHVRVFLSRYKGHFECKSCKGTRLSKKALAIKIGGVNIAELSAMTIKEAACFFKGLKLGPKEAELAKEALKQVAIKLQFLSETGLEHLTLNRLTRTLSGGETQRVALCNQLASALSGVLYILDEPSVGLHPRDIDTLIGQIQQIAARDNTVVVVEHDTSTIRAADHVIELGPGSGELGGRLVYSGALDEFTTEAKTLTAEYLRGEKQIKVPRWRRRGSGESLRIIGAKGHNLKNIDIEIPLGTLTCVTGVSGSGKSSLIMDTLYKAIAPRFQIKTGRALAHSKVEGAEKISEIKLIDQEPIGKTPRSNPITYIGGFDEIRSHFSSLRAARAMNLTPGHFSFNVPGGRCESCKGEGLEKLEMYFLPDVFITCASCEGRRYKPQVLEIKSKDRNIHDVLEMTFDEAAAFFQSIPGLAKKISVIKDVGLGYLKLGQSATTLSGGEAQRLKIARELGSARHSRRLAARGNGKDKRGSEKEPSGVLYILDEPTTGLHTDDTKKLLYVLSRLVDSGNTVLIIEHNMECVKTADHVIDIGPEGGKDGGLVVVTGTPEQVAEAEKGHTGRYLKEALRERR